MSGPESGERLERAITAAVLDSKWSKAAPKAAVEPRQEAPDWTGFDARPVRAGPTRSYLAEAEARNGRSMGR